MRLHVLLPLFAIGCAGTHPDVAVGQDEVNGKTGPQALRYDAIGSLRGTIPEGGEAAACSGALVGSRAVLTSRACATSLGSSPKGALFSAGGGSIPIVRCSVTGEVGMCALASEASDLVPLRFADAALGVGESAKRTSHNGLRELGPVVVREIRGRDVLGQADLCAADLGSPIVRIEDGEPRIVAVVSAVAGAVCGTDFTATSLPSEARLGIARAIRESRI